jgi:hypothetical protein
MIARHQPLWSYVRDFIYDNNIKSIFEVGCGMCPPAKDWAVEWTGVDVNSNTDAIHEDFLHMNMSRWKDVDLFLACGVVEHCKEGLEEFLTKAKEISAKYYFVSFFNGLRRRRSYPNLISKHKCGSNKYSKKHISKIAESLGFRYKVVTINNRDDVLVLEED